MDLSVIVLAKNESKYIASCIESIIAAFPKHLKCEIIVVDNNSEDETGNIARSKGAFTISSNSEYIGHLRNIGAKVSSGQIIAYIDADCTAPRNWIETAIDHFKDEQVSAVGGYLDLPPDCNWVQAAWAPVKKRRKRLARGLVGASLFCRKSVFDNIGGFDDTLKTGEDSDLYFRLVNNNNIVYSDNRCNVVHWGYPKTLIGVADRQIWQVLGHKSIHQVLNNRSIVVSYVFVISFFLSAVLFLLQQYVIGFGLLFFFLLPPLVFSFKKIRHTSIHIWSVNFYRILIVSIFYYFGRFLGSIFFILKLKYKRRYK